MPGDAIEPSGVLWAWCPPDIPDDLITPLLKTPGITDCSKGL